MASEMIKLSRVFESILEDNVLLVSEGEKREKREKIGARKQAIVVGFHKAGDKARSITRPTQGCTGDLIEPDEVLGPDKRNMQQEQENHGKGAIVGDGGKEIMMEKGTHQNPYLSTCVLPGPRNPAKVLDSR